MVCYAAEPTLSLSRRCESGDGLTQSGRPVKLFADALYWRASEETSSIWATIGTTSFNPLIKDSWIAKNISFGCDLGWRVGCGRELFYDLWDTEIFWSSFRTEAHSTIPNTSNLIIPQFFGGFVNGDHPLNGQLKWKILYNMADWELGRMFFVSSRVCLRPFIGLKGGWIFQTVDSTWQVDERDVHGINIPVDYIAMENLKNDFWGVGPSGGFHTIWTLACFSKHALQLYGDFSMAFMWGTWSFQDEYHNPTPYRISTNVDDLHLGALALSGFLGIGWEKSYETKYISAKVGYETQLWINQVRFPTFQQVLLHGDLTLQGGTFHVQIDF